MQMRPAPKKSLGQNFLNDGNARRRMIAACAFTSGDVVLEIGPGQGALTPLIAGHARKVYAVELDRRLAALLAGTFADSPTVAIIPGDILKFDISSLPETRSQKIKVFGNIPYYITSPIIEHLVLSRGSISEIFLTVQKEFARRIAAAPGGKEYGSFSCFVQYYFEPKTLFDIKKNSFFPVPKVDSSFIRLRVREQAAVTVPDEERLFRVIRTAFQQRRKTIRNSLKDILAGTELEEACSRGKIDPGARPERLSLRDFACLAGG